MKEPQQPKAASKDTVRSLLVGDDGRLENTQLTIKKAIDLIGKKVIFHGDEVVFSWQQAEAYFGTQQSKSDNSSAKDLDDFTAEVLDVFISELASGIFINNNLVSIEFKAYQTSIAFTDFLLYIFPLHNIEYPKSQGNTTLITLDQYYFCKRFNEHDTRKLSTTYLGDSLLKTLRADEFDFSHQFLLGILPGENGARRLHNLRPVNRKLYTLTSKKKIKSRLGKEPMHTAEEKQGFSQIQSSTLIDKLARSPAFGFTRGRKNKLYGLMTHISDALINRMLINDSGTVNRPFDLSETKSEITHSTLLYSQDEIDGFKVDNIQSRPKNSRTNEVLARLRFNPYKSVVSICSDTLEARLLAYDFAQELLERYAATIEKSGAKLNPRYKIPIIFYVPNGHWFRQRIYSDHDLTFYSAEMHQRDQAEASAIFEITEKRQQHYQEHDYEFLLGLQEITLDILLEPVCDAKDETKSVPLALDMMRKGFARMLMRLLRVAKNRSNLREALVHSLVSNKMLEQNDPAIVQLILAEEFDIADQFIAATQSNKDSLFIHGELLTHHLVKNGNPRQINYMGLEKLLLCAAENNFWVAIRLCMKEYPDLDKVFLGKLLSQACKFQQHVEAEFLLEMGADRTDSTQRSAPCPPIHIAANAKDWLMVEIFSGYPSDPQDQASYGYAWFHAMLHGKRIIAKRLSAAGAKPDFCRKELQFQLLPVIDHGFNTLLLEHEKNVQNLDPKVPYRLALDFAAFKGNERGVVFLSHNYNPATPIDPANIKRSICYLVLEAMAIEQRQFAEWRLLRYCHQYKLLAEDDKNVIVGLRIIMDFFHEILGTLPAFSGATTKITISLVEILLDHDELDLFQYLLNESDYRNIRHKIGAINDVYFAVLKCLSVKNISLIKEVVNKTLGSDYYYSWRTKRFEAFELEFHSHFKSDKIFLLVELGLKVQEEDLFHIMKAAISHGNFKVAKLFFNQPGNSEATKEKLLATAIEHSTSFDSDAITHYFNSSTEFPCDKSAKNWPTFFYQQPDPGPASGIHLLSDAGTNLEIQPASLLQHRDGVG